jgi:glycine oxidase
MGPPDVIVVGGGLVGAACARQLAAQHLRVEILDSGAEPGIASAAAGGMLAPLAESLPENPTLSLLVRGRDLYQELAPLLKEETGIDIGLWSEGIVQLAMTTSEAAELTHEIAWQRQRGFKSDWLSQEDLLDRYPGLSHDVVGGKLAPEDGAVEPESLLKAFHASAKRHGAKLRRGVRVRQVIVEGNSVTGVRTENETMRAGTVVIAAGAWSGRIGGLPRPLSVEPIRGQMVAVDWLPGEPPAIVYAGAGYVLHRGGDALGGTTMEHAGFEASTTESGIAHVREVMRTIYPALENVEVKRAWAGLRPCTPDGHPIVGPDAEVDALWYATGHGRNGVLLAAITGEIISHLFTDEPIDFDISPIDPGRYWKTERP